MKGTIAVLSKPSTWVSTQGEPLEVSTFPPFEPLRIDGDEKMVAAPIISAQADVRGQGTIHQQLRTGLMWPSKLLI